MSRNVKVIVDFLNMWEERVFNFYNSHIQQYYKELDRIKTLQREYANNPDNEDKEQSYRVARQALYCKLHGYTEKQPYTDRWGHQYHRSVKVKDGEWEHIKQYVEGRSLSEAIQRLNNDLQQEKNRKYDFIIERTNKIVGQITDASNLSIGMSNDLNGIVIGTQGTAKVRTIGAGGYNIQCFHFRTLINEVK